MIINKTLISVYWRDLKSLVPFPQRPLSPMIRKFSTHWCDELYKSSITLNGKLPQQSCIKVRSRNCFSTGDFWGGGGEGQRSVLCKMNRLLQFGGRTGLHCVLEVDPHENLWPVKDLRSLAGDPPPIPSTPYSPFHPQISWFSIPGPPKADLSPKSEVTQDKHCVDTRLNIYPAWLLKF